MADINLLPVTVKDNSPTSKFAVLSKKLGMIAAVIIGCVLLVYGAIYAYFYVNGSVTTSSITTLENQITAQEQTEQKIILLRDRATKAGQIVSQASTSDELDSLSDVLTHLPEGVTVRESKILPSELAITIHADQSSKISEFVRALTESGKYAQIDAVSMDFSAKDQYISVYRLVLGQATSNN